MEIKNRFKKKYDIAVIGGGVAGCAAAIKAASSGMKTILIEKQCTVGGLATSGFINIFLPLCDGQGNQILFGLVEDFIKLAIQYGPFDLPPGWGGKSGEKISRYMTKFSPAGFAISLEHSLINSSVDIWYDTVFLQANLKTQHIHSINIANESGIGEITADYYIDASGSAVLSKSAGIETEIAYNLPASWSINASMQQAENAIKFQDPELLLNLLKLGNKLSEKQDISNQTLSDSGKSVSEFLIQEHNLQRNYYDTQTNDFQFPIAIANMPHLRTVRKIKGLNSVSLHNKTSNNSKFTSLLPDWRTPGILWELPFEAMITNKIDNLITAGRIISSDSLDAWEVLRAIPACIHSGEIAGKASAICKTKNIPVTEIENGELRMEN